MSKRNYDHLIKIMLLGDSSVGKTCLMHKYTENRTVESHLPTVGIDFRIVHLEVNGQRIKLQIWDTAGQERFDAITSSYYKHADGVCLMFDKTSPSSFQSVAKWLRNVDEQAKEECLKQIVGNKSDLADLHVVETKHAQEVAERFGLPYMETSALTGLNVKSCFENLVERILEQKKLRGEAAAVSENSKNRTATKTGEGDARTNNNDLSFYLSLNSAIDSLSGFYSSASGSNSKLLNCC